MGLNISMQEWFLSFIVFDSFFTLSPPRQVPAAGQARHLGGDALKFGAAQPIPNRGSIEYVPGLQYAQPPNWTCAAASARTVEYVSKVRTYPLGQI